MFPADERAKREELLSRGLLRTKSREEYMLRHLGLSQARLPAPKRVDLPPDLAALHEAKFKRRASMPSSSASLGVRRSFEASCRRDLHRDDPVLLTSMPGSSQLPLPPGFHPRDPVMAAQMHGPPLYSPALCRTASAFL
mmetsp:Transcript_99119/g.212372  ORF Transcript_99119/g.212372 Transcript_99119/m.212372 type:complete len:139 (-) Transcript_99119:66-482(-)